MDVSLSKPLVTLTLTVEEARSLFYDLEDMNESPVGPGITRTSMRLMAELGATLEDEGYLIDPDDDPDGEPEEAAGFVVAVDGDPAVIDWDRALINAKRDRVA